jgi:hypothetical protein
MDPVQPSGERDVVGQVPVTPTDLVGAAAQQHLNMVCHQSMSADMRCRDWVKRYQSIEETAENYCKELVLTL